MKRKNSSLLVVMAKEPEPGRVKTRLSPPLGTDEGAALSRALIRDKLGEMSHVKGADLALAFTPKSGRDFFEPLAGKGVRLFAQRGRGLGEKMLNIFRDCFDEGFQAISVTGTDIPELPYEIAEESLSILSGQEADVALGPASDGGYYLIGMTKPQEALFSGVPWSTPAVLEATLKKARAMGLRVKMLPEFGDIDTIEDLRGFVGRYRKGSPGGHTFKFASKLPLLK